MAIQANIPGYYSTNQAAILLGVTAHQVGALARNGEIALAQTVGRTLMLNADSVQRYQRVSQGKGRPLDEATAFAALGALSGIPPCQLSYQQRRRLRAKLMDIGAEDLVWQTRKRKSTKRYRCSLSFLAELASMITLSGASAMDNDFDLTSTENLLEGYAEKTCLGELVDRFFLQEDPKGNTIIHVTNAIPWKNDKMPVGVIAADLAESLNTRERSVGLEKIGELLHEYHNLQHE